MAKIHPPIETIQKSRQKPTEGELYLLGALEKEFFTDANVYFQPYFNGERPDIVIVHKDRGVIIIEVKDWDLSLYYLDENNKWHLKQNDALLRSPFQQVFGYKTNMFEIHVNGLLEHQIKNSNFYKVISCFVYFHCADKNTLSSFYAPQVERLKKEINDNNNDRANSLIEHHKYEKRADYLQSKRKRFERDLQRHSLSKDQFYKLQFPFLSSNGLFTESVYKEFVRYLQPPFHALTEGIPIKYERKQLRLIESRQDDRMKIKGVAGSGKTAVLAKRAVNAHKRHGDRVLVLTFNLTLRMYIRDKISEVRDDFSWGFFDIINYHRFFNQQINSLGIAFDIPEEIKNDDEKRNAFIDRYYYSNESVFEGCDISHKYQTILIDEIQDYKAEWIKIIRNYFLADEGEMVLIGDEKQNIYERELENDRTSRTVQGFRRWQVLTKCYRSASDSPLVNLAKEFQSVYFSGIYEGDFDPNEQLQISNLDIKECLVYNPRNIRSLIQYIFETARKKHIHPNDITILASRIDTLREIDYFIRNDIEFNEKTLTTFETKEELPYLPSKKDIEKLRANRKYGFNLNSGVVKLSTIHSFKGYESPTVFLILDDRDNAELVYVGITRAKINLIVFVDANSRYRSFFEQRLDCVTLRTHIAVR